MIAKQCVNILDWNENAGRQAIGLRTYRPRHNRKSLKVKTVKVAKTTNFKEEIVEEINRIQSDQSHPILVINTHEEMKQFKLPEPEVSQVDVLASYEGARRKYNKRNQIGIAGGQSAESLGKAGAASESGASAVIVSDESGVSTKAASRGRLEMLPTASPSAAGSSRQSAVPASTSTQRDKIRVPVQVTNTLQRAVRGRRPFKKGGAVVKFKRGAPK